MKVDIQTGERFGRLVVVKEAEQRTTISGKKRRQFECLCDCGKEKTILLTNLRAGKTNSCGCSQVIHGMRSTDVYKIWSRMKDRCSNNKNIRFSRYGGRGIKVYPEWEKSFSEFFSYVGPRPAGTSLDRIDNNKGYEPGNVRWATKKEQARNKSTSIQVIALGEIMNLSEACERLGINYKSAHCALKKKSIFCGIATNGAPV